MLIWLIKRGGEKNDGNILEVYDNDDYLFLQSVPREMVETEEFPPHDKFQNILTRIAVL
jgi:hypothetical protein